MLPLSNIENEINFNNHDICTNFSTIVSKYRSVRTLDTKPISHIKDKLKEKSKINMADIGYDDERYSLEFLRHFDDLEQITWHDENILLEIRK